MDTVGGAALVVLALVAMAIGIWADLQRGEDL